MIRNVVVHLLNEQPLLADLFEMPKALDQGLLCTNLRLMDGKKPVFVDRLDSTFFFPYLHIRFIEILPSPDAIAEAAAATAEPAKPAEEAAPDEDLELDEDFLRRIREV